MIDFLRFNFWDVIDITLTSILIYFFLRLFRGTRVPQMLVGLLIIIFVALGAYIFDLAAMKWFIASFKTIGLVAIVIVFQPEIRRALAAIGRTPWIKTFFSPGENSLIRATVESLINASFTLRDKGFGALIVIERQMGLKEYVERGAIILMADVSAPLIVTLFTPPAPLHDGAIIVRGNKIFAGGCTLPMSESQEIDPALGMRHRAAIGITEVSDALCIVISEEMREVSLSVGGKLLRNLNRSTLRTNLISLLRAEFI